MNTENFFVNNDDETLEIPQYEELKDVLKCKDCNNSKCSYSRNGYGGPSSEWYCENKRKMINILEIIVGIVIIIISFSLLYLLSKNFFITLMIGVAIFGIMIWLNFEFFEKMMKNHYEKNENERKEQYNKKVSEINAENERIHKEKTGETKEYYAFKDKVRNLTEKITNIAKLDFSDKTNEMLSIIKMFREVALNLEELENKINPTNYQYHYIQSFYNVHLNKLIENVEIFVNKIKSNDISEKERKVFKELIESFATNISHISMSLKENDEDNFINKMKDLQNVILVEEKNGETS